MVLPKKGFRKIVIDENQFVWKVRKKISWNEIHDVPLGIPIQNINGGQLLIITIGYSRSYFAENNEFQITPSIIKICIKKAIESGWNHNVNGPRMEFDCSELVKDFMLNKNGFPTKPKPH